MAILALYNSGVPSKPSVLIKPNGEIKLGEMKVSYILGGTNENFEFIMNEDTQVYSSCSAELNGEMLIFGGSIETKQVKIV